MLPDQNDPRFDFVDPDAFDIKRSISAVVRSTRRYWRTVLACTILTIGLVALYVRLYPPVFIGSSSLMAEREYDAPRDQFYVDWDIFRKDDSRTEIELMKSGSVLTEVIQRENLTYDDVYHPFLSHTVYLWETSLVGRAYRSVKRALLGEEDLGLTKEDLDFARTIGDFREGISVDPVGESNVGLVTVKGPTRRVASMANTLVDVYLRQRSERHVKEASQALDTLTEQTKVASIALTEAETRRLEFTSENRLAFDFQKESVEVTKLAELEAAIAASQSKVAALESSIGEVDRELAKVPNMITTSSVSALNSLRQNLQLKRLDLETSLISVRERYLDDSPEVLELQRNLRELDDMLAGQTERVTQAETLGLNALAQDLHGRRNALVTDLVGTRSGLKVMHETAFGLGSRLSLVPAMQAKLKELDRDVAVSGERYQRLNAKRVQAEVSAVTALSAGSSLRVVDLAMPPTKAYWPKTKLLYLAALAVGLLLGIVMAIFRNELAGEVNREDVERGASTGLPLYGVLHLSGISPAISLIGSGAYKRAKSATAGETRTGATD